MLLKFGAKNFFCFKEGVEISFKLKSNCPESVSQGKTYSNILCVKGANGSGKTNALKILPFLSNFCCNSFENKPEDGIQIATFFYNKKPSEFFIEFSIDNKKYTYILVTTEKAVISETIYRTEKRLTKIIERKENKMLKCVKDYNELEVIKLRSNASIISTSKQYEISCMVKFYNFFDAIISNIHHSLGFRLNEKGYQIISEFYKNRKEYFNFTKKLICQFDLGINNIELIPGKDENGKDFFFPIFHHKRGSETGKLVYHLESSGTKSLFLQLWKYRVALLFGGVLVLDEFDINLHPHILPVLINLFLDKEINKKNAQLIFSTHYSEIMNLMGKYRTVLVNKEDNQSYAFRLDEIPGDIIRNDRPISPIYNAGKIGGVPQL